MLGRNRLKVDRLVTTISARFNVKIVKFANVGNHLHLVVKLPSRGSTSRRQYSKWIRLLTSRIAFEIGGSKKGEPFRDEDGRKAKFWDAIPFSRVIHGRRGWDVVDQYVLKNEFQAQGFSKDMAEAMAEEIYDSRRAFAMPDWTDSA